MCQQGQNLIALLRSVLTDTAAKLREPDHLKIFTIAQAHSVSNLLYIACRKLPPEEQPDAVLLRRYKELAFAAASRDALQTRELAELLASLHKKGIEALPLKGCVIKTLYPKVEYRYMSDTDLLIEPSQAEAVRQVMAAQGFHVARYDVSDTDFYVSPTGMNYELHRDLREEGYTKASEEFLSKLRDYAKVEGDALVLPAEEHYAYVLAHAVKHLLKGGTGLRTVMDVYVCKHCWQFDKDKLKRLLRQTDLYEFCLSIEALAESWFGGTPMSEDLRELEEYILSGAVFGTEERRIESRLMLQEDEGRGRYWLKRFFLPYRTMCIYFPVLKKCPILLPFLWIYRGFRGVFGRSNKVRNEAAVVKATGREVLDQRYAMFVRSGLKLDERKDGKK